MEITWRLEYEVSVVKTDIPRLSHSAKKQIKKAIEEKLATRPEIFGKPLRKSLKGHRSLRVGDYRVIFRICADEETADSEGTARGTVKIFAILHRSIAYKLKKR